MRGPVNDGAPECSHITSRLCQWIHARVSDGLVALAESEFGLEPLSGRLFVFLNRHPDCGLSGRWLTQLVGLRLATATVDA